MTTEALGVFSLKSQDIYICKMARIGSIGEFNAEVEDWEMYVERVNLYCTANNIANDKKNAVLLTLMGAKSYRNIRALCAPTPVTEKNHLVN